MNVSPVVDIAAGRKNVAKHVNQVTGNGDFLDRISQFTILDQEAGRSA
jgi:hypothetical protein